VAHRWTRAGAAAVVDCEVGKAFDSVLHNNDCIKGALQHLEEYEGVLAW
jgi:hypothetical protein